MLKNKGYRKNLSILLELAKRTGLYLEKSFTTTELSKDLGLSQQSVSRKLVMLEKSGYIKRAPSVNGISIKLTEKAVDELKICYSELKLLFTGRRKCILKGIVESGLGEGRFYTELSGYKKQFIDKLGIVPYPGTLNLHVNEEDRMSFLSCKPYIEINGFKTADRTYGALKSYSCKINGISVSIIVPDRNLHKPDTVEVVCEKDLRKTLKLKDGDEVTLK